MDKKVCTYNSRKLKLVKPWEVKSFERKPPYVRTMKILMGPETHGVKHLSINMVIIPPGSSSDVHVHEESEEYWIIIDGRGEIVVDDDKIAIEPGMIVYAAPKSKHCIINTGNEPLKAYFLFAPPGPEKTLLKLMEKGET